MPQNLLQLSRIGKSFGPNRVLDGVSFDLHAGEVTSSPEKTERAKAR